MKHDPKLKEKLIVNIKERKQEYIDNFDLYVKRLGSAKSVEDIMIMKRDFLVNLTCLLPADSSDCYFCLANAIKSDPYVDCDSCEYAKTHGVCHNPTSDWMKQNRAKYRFVSVIRSKYYKGEKYKK